jgi:hypothetical protein
MSSRTESEIDIGAGCCGPELDRGEPQTQEKEILCLRAAGAEPVAIDRAARFASPRVANKSRVTRSQFAATGRWGRTVGIGAGDKARQPPTYGSHGTTTACSPSCTAILPPA